MKAASLGLLGAGLLTLAACGGGSDSSSSPPPPPAVSTAQFNFSVSDAPVDAAAAVVLCFNAIELTGNGGATRKFLIGSDAVAAAPNNLCRDASGNVIANSRGVDLLQLPGATAEALVTGAVVDAGAYGQLRLVVSEGSYIELLDGSRVGLTVPSNEIKLLGPVLSAGSTFSYTLEFDLRKAVVMAGNSGKYQLKPTGLRMVDTSQIGHLQGQVSESILLNAQCPLAPADSRMPVAMVYLYKGLDLPLGSLSDYGGVLLNLPYASAPVMFDGASSYQYQLGYIDAGSYTVALTCNLNDSPEQADPLVFLQAKNLTMVAGKTPLKLDF